MDRSGKTMFARFSATMFAGLVAALASLALVALPVSAEPIQRKELTQRQRDGKRIFFRGETGSGRPVFATLGDPPMQVSATMLPCVNCHGFDGRGMSEAGVLSSDISWSALTKPYGAILPTGRRRSAYNEATLKRAITQGIDPSSNRLGVGMPQFQMNDVDLESLIAYIKRIETDVDPGVTDTEIVVATILPRHTAGSLPAERIGDLLRARFKQVNETGGVYGRTITLRVLDAAEHPAASVAILTDFLKTEPVFAVIAPFVPGASAELAALAGAREIPIIAPLAGPPNGVDEWNRFVFYLYSGLNIQVRVLVDDLLRQDHPDQPSTYALLSHQGGPFEQLARVVQNRFKERGRSDIALTTYDNASPSSEVLTNIFKTTDGVFLFGSDAELAGWLSHANKIGVSPKILVVSASLGEQTLAALQSYDGTLVAVFPNTNAAQSPRARAAFRTFLKRHELNTDPDAAGLAAYCGASLFLEGIENAGRQLRRERLIRELEGLYEFRTGLTRDLSYGPTRRIGARGAYVVTFVPHSPTTLPNSRWVEFVD